MKSGLTSLAVFVAALAFGCGCAANRTRREVPPPGGVLMQADRDFALAAWQRGVAIAFRDFASADALSLPNGESPVVGRDAIFQSMSTLPPGELSWQPVGADLARSGELGYTWGNYEFRTRDTDGTPVTRHGKYVTIWKKQGDGSWKFVLDSGNTSPTPP